MKKKKTEDKQICNDGGATMGWKYIFGKRLEETKTNGTQGPKINSKDVYKQGMGVKQERQGLVSKANQDP